MNKIYLIGLCLFFVGHSVLAIENECANIKIYQALKSLIGIRYLHNCEINVSENLGVEVLPNRVLYISTMDLYLCEKAGKCFTSIFEIKVPQGCFEAKPSATDQLPIGVLTEAGKYFAQGTEYFNGIQVVVNAWQQIQRIEIIKQNQSTQKLIGRSICDPDLDYY